MPSPSAICTVNGVPLATSGTTGANVLQGTTVTIALASVAGVVNGGWAISCTQSDDLTNPITINNTLVVTGYPNFTATFTAPLLVGIRGAAMIFTSTVNPGKSNQDT